MTNPKFPVGTVVRSHYDGTIGIVCETPTHHEYTPTMIWAMWEGSDRPLWNRPGNIDVVSMTEEQILSEYSID